MLSSGQSSWLQMQRCRVRFPALPDFAPVDCNSLHDIPSSYELSCVYDTSHVGVAVASLSSVVRAAAEQAIPRGVMVSQISRFSFIVV
jgi:hypothetical protein